MILSIKRRPPVDDSFLNAALHPRLKQIYASRGIARAEQLDTGLKSLLHYNLMAGIDAAAEIVSQAIVQQRKIVVVGDFDADGATSTALMMLSLTALGSKNHHYLVPNRFDFGYGLSPEIVEVAHQQQAAVIITVDNGISCLAGVQRAKTLGMQVVVTDHHLPSQTLPAADAIVNPNQPDCRFPSKSIAGVGVAFYLMLAVRGALQAQKWFEAQAMPPPKLADFLDLVALGTVADVVALDDNNRILVHQGLQRIRKGTCRTGISELLQVAGRKQGSLTASDLGFVLGPRLNAAGRLDDMALGIECLLTSDPLQARKIAVQLDSLNRERREIESSMQQDAEKTLAELSLQSDNLPHGIVLYRQDFHQGVIGILAGRIKDRYFRPTVAFAHQDDDIIKGSARSVEGVHIRDLLDELNVRYPHILHKFGGHAMAAGLAIHKRDLARFEEAFVSLSEEKLAGRPLQGEYLTDGPLTSAELGLEFAQLLRHSGPWGQQFGEPTFDGTFKLLDQRIVGQKHLKMVISNDDGVAIDAIAFNVDTQRWPDSNIKHVQLVYKLDINEFRGKVSVQLIVDALAAA